MATSSDDGKSTDVVSLEGTRGLRLVITGPDFTRSVPLPSSGAVILGRSSAADVTVDSPSVSRSHARLTMGPTITIEDLGSANGTLVGSTRVLPSKTRELNATDIIELGDVMLVIKGSVPSARPRRVWTHGYFEGRVEEECERARRSSRTFAVIRVSVREQSPPPAVQAVLIRNLRPGDPVAVYGPVDFEALVVDATADQAHEVVGRLRADLDAAGLAARIGVACFPVDGRSPEELMSSCGDAVNETGKIDDGPDMVIEAPAMKRLHEIVARTASSDLSILLLGETGVGKEVLAHRIHELSPRSNMPFVALCCAAFTDTLLESELFGYEKGAFTGAGRAKPGLFETGEGGTVFLDEIGDMPLALQAKLLRVLETRQVMRVGGLKEKPIDVRFVAATNQDLESNAQSGRFRADLYFRLSGITLMIPPLRERTPEISPLAMTFAAAAARRFGRREHPEIDAEAMEVLTSYAWPGNIRELRNVIDRAVLLSSTGRVERENLSIDKMSTRLSYAEPPSTRMLGGEPSEFDMQLTSPIPRLDNADLDHSPGRLHEDVQALERVRIVEALATCDGNQSKAAKLLGISRTTLGARMETFGLPRPRKGKRRDPS